MTRESKKEMIRTVKYFAFAISAGVIEMVSFTLFTELTSWSYWPCYLIALVLSVLWNFTWNRRYTFQASNNVSIAITKVFIYYLIFTPVSTIMGSYLVDNLHWNAYLITILNMLFNGITEYLYQRLFVYGDAVDTYSSPKYLEIHNQA